MSCSFLLFLFFTIIRLLIFSSSFSLYLYFFHFFFIVQDCPICHTRHEREQPPTKRQALCREIEATVQAQTQSMKPNQIQTTTSSITSSSSNSITKCSCVASEFGLCAWQGSEEDKIKHEGSCQAAKIAVLLKGISDRSSSAERELHKEIESLRESIGTEKKNQQLLQRSWKAQIQTSIDGVKTMLTAELASVRASVDATVAKLLSAHAQISDSMTIMQREHAQALKQVREDIENARKQLNESREQEMKRQRGELEGVRDEMTRQVLRRLE